MGFLASSRLTTFGVFSLDRLRFRHPRWLHVDERLPTLTGIRDDRLLLRSLQLRLLVANEADQLLQVFLEFPRGTFGDRELSIRVGDEFFKPRG